MEKSDDALSRRDLLVNAGKCALGGAVIATAMPGFSSRAEAAGGSTEKWPWPYVKLDPDQSAELAYKEWYRVFCGGAVISSIFTQLREKVGGPYNSFPIDSFICLEGGIAGWGTVCGCNSGANVVTNVIIGPRIAGPECEHGHSMGADMMEWYSNTSLPTFTPKNPKQKTPIIKTVAGSPLCHVSVGKWMKASGHALGSPERKDRCARLAASVTRKLVLDLNAWKDGKFEPESDWAPGSQVGITGQQNCGECHTKEIPVPPSANKK